MHTILKEFEAKRHAHKDTFYVQTEFAKNSILQGSIAIQRDPYVFQLAESSVGSSIGGAVNGHCKMAINDIQ